MGGSTVYIMQDYHSEERNVVCPPPPPQVKGWRGSTSLNNLT